LPIGHAGRTIDQRVAGAPLRVGSPTLGNCELKEACARLPKCLFLLGKTQTSRPRPHDRSGDDRFLAAWNGASERLRTIARCTVEIIGDAVEILVAAPGQVHDHQMIVRFLRREIDHARERMRGLKRGNNAFEPRA
jgi:hypothetical protein